MYVYRELIAESVQVPSVRVNRVVKVGRIFFKVNKNWIDDDSEIEKGVKGRLYV